MPDDGERTFGRLEQAMLDLKASVERIEKSLEKQNDKLEARITELEKRVRALENNKWWLLGASATFGYVWMNVGKLLGYLKGAQ